ncbi:LysR family transcriptional regulator [bacterium LRH843]|nr:LysR family transcriptional regulator [bacterium LRH843]
MQIQLKDLTIFVKVADNRSFTRTAEILFIAQPSLSKSVQKLEREVGVTLLDRSDRQLRLTDAGKIVYEKSKEILATLNSISTSISELSELITGQLKIGIPPIIGAFIFPKIAEDYGKGFPGITLELKEESALVTEKLVETGELDIGFVVLPILNANLNTISIYKDEFVLCVSSNHPLADLKEVSLKDLQDESFILFAKAAALHKLIVNECKMAGYSPNIAFESTQWDLVLELVSAQFGITIIPRILANKLNGVSVVTIPIVNPSIVWEIGIITNKNSYKSFALEEFLNIVNEIYGDK